LPEQTESTHSSAVSTVGYGGLGKSGPRLSDLGPDLTCLGTHLPESRILTPGIPTNYDGIDHHGCGVLRHDSPVTAPARAYQAVPELLCHCMLQPIPRPRHTTPCEMCGWELSVDMTGRPTCGSHLETLRRPNCHACTTQHTPDVVPFGVLSLILKRPNHLPTSMTLTNTQVYGRQAFQSSYSPRCVAPKSASAPCHIAPMRVDITQRPHQLTTLPRAGLGLVALLPHDVLTQRRRISLSRGRWSQPPTHTWSVRDVTSPNTT
jgi:hypothetical protein